MLNLSLSSFQDDTQLTNFFKNLEDDTFGLPRSLSGKESACKCRRHRRAWFNPQVSKILWRRKWQPTPGFLPGKSHRESSLEGYSPWGGKRVRHDLIIYHQQIILSAFISGYKPMLAGKVRMRKFWGGSGATLFTYLNLSFFIYTENDKAGFPKDLR